MTAQVSSFSNVNIFEHHMALLSKENNEGAKTCHITRWLKTTRLEEQEEEEGEENKRRRMKDVAATLTTAVFEIIADLFCFSRGINSDLSLVAF